MLRDLNNQPGRNTTDGFDARRPSRGAPRKIRGGGDPKSRMALEPRLRLGPPPRSFAADAHGCIMVRVPGGPTEYKFVAR